MKFKTWSHERDQSKSKKYCYKSCMLTYQTGDWIKAGVHLGEGYMGCAPLPFFQTDQNVPSKPSKWMSVCNKFLNHKISFWKQKSRVYVILFCAYIIELQSCDLVVCLALEHCSNLNFVWLFLKSMVPQLLKSGALKCNHGAIQNFCAYNFFFLSNQVLKKWQNCLPAKVSIQTNMIYSVRVFYLVSICLQGHVEIKWCLSY